MNKGGYMTKLIITISFLLVLGSPFANAEQVYYCASEISTGIDKDEKTGMWEQYKFQSKRYTIKFSSDFSKLSGVDPMGGFMLCKTPHNNLKKYNHLVVCYNTDNVGFVFMFDKKTNRFINSTAGILGYLSEGTATDVLYAGTCKKF